MVMPIAQPTGTPAFHKAREAVLARLDKSIPDELRLPQSLLNKLPNDVTGIPASCGLLSKEELAITELDGTAVRDQIASGKMTAVEAVSAFGKRAVIAHQLVFCCTDIFLEEGIAQAKALDEHFKKTGKVVGPLHGVPISVKEHLPLKGRWESDAFIATLKISEEDMHLVAVMRKLGAVFYVKTMQPQTLMHLETDSFYGRCLNPYNLNLTPGGSSGGESALVAMKGSVIGLGADGGGSVRCPAAHTGIYGMRSTTLVMPACGMLLASKSDTAVGSTGAMTASARDTQLFFDSVLSTNPHLTDPNLIPQNWTLPDLSSKKLKIGIMRHDGGVLPQPPMLRGFDTVVSKLGKSAQIELIEFKPYKNYEIWKYYNHGFWEDGGAYLRKMMKEGGEDAFPLTDWILETCTVHEMSESWQRKSLRAQYRMEYAAHWQESGIDLLLCPPYHGTAALHDTSRYWGYTATYNMLDYPGFVFPSGLFADEKVDKKVERTEFMSPEDEYNYKIYEPELYHGAPISMQLLAYPRQDAFLVAAQEVVEAAIKA